MKKQLIILIIAILPFANYAQDKVGVNFGQTFSDFKFKDSQGNEDTNMNKDIKFSYALNYEKVFSPGIYIRSEIGFKNMGAKSRFNNTNIEWDFHYLDFNVSGGYIYNSHRLKPYVGIGFFYAFLYKADQIIGSESYDLLTKKAIAKTDLGLNLNFGLRYDYSDNSGVFIEYRNSMGLSQLDKNINGGSKELYNRASSFYIGLTFSIINKRSGNK